MFSDLRSTGNYLANKSLMFVPKRHSPELSNLRHSGTHGAIDRWMFRDFRLRTEGPKRRPAPGVKVTAITCEREDSIYSWGPT